ncbi:MAG: hypothetical protein JXB50_00855 [Spirochaetes bacterium]|nr:hypothetical protein [Spirochaetota bacterium]
MKKFFISFLTLLAMIFLTENIDSQEITISWIKSRSNIRTYYKTNNRKLIEFDRISLNNLEKGNINIENESLAADLIKEIIADNMAINNENPITGLDILQKKFQNKKYYFQVTTDISFHYSTKNPFVIARIFNGLKELLESTFDENLKTCKAVFLYIKTPYIIASQNNTVKYGTEIITIEIIAYIREFLRIKKNGRTAITPEQEFIIKDIYENLSIEQGNFSKLPGAKELLSEY